MSELDKLRAELAARIFSSLVGPDRYSITQGAAFASVYAADQIIDAVSRKQSDVHAEAEKVIAMWKRWAEQASG